MDKIIGILGGMGPLATIRLFENIVLNTPAKKDQDHFRIIIDNNTKIPDRTEFIMGRGESPLPKLIESAQFLENSGVSCILIPCNTSHYFIDELQKHVKIPILNMIEETARYLKSMGVKNAALFSTLGTYKAKIYPRVFEKFDLNIMEPEEKDKLVIHDIIYNKIKSNANFGTDFISEFERIFHSMVPSPDVAIKGCTEISLLKLPFNTVDPLEVLAKTAISKMSS